MRRSSDVSSLGSEDRQIGDKTVPSSKAAGALLENVDVLEAVFQSLPVGVVVCDENGQLIFHTAEAERILGTSPKDVRPDEWTVAYGCYLADMLTPYPVGQLPLTRSMQGKEVRNELVFIRNRQQPAGVWISVNGGPLRDKTGTSRGGVVVFRDVTESQNLLRNHVEMPPGNEEEKPGTELLCSTCPVLERFERFRSIYGQLCRAVEQTADTVLITNRQGVIEYVNPAFEQTTGYAGNEVLGRTPAILKSGLHDEQFYQDLWNQLLAGQPFRGTIVNRKKSGELYWAEQTITPMRDERQQITHFVSVLKDVTELRKKQEQDFYLRIAREVQQRFYSVATVLPGFDIAGAAYPADDTGGDHFDFIRQPDGCVCLVIGDVSGHGFGAALVMAETRAYVRSCAKFESDAGSLLTDVNRFLAEDLHDGRHVTLAVIRLDPRNLSFTYASAGHVPCYLLRRSGETGTVMESTGPPLGLFPDVEFSSSPVIPLEAGDTFVLLTDGITESSNRDEAEFGPERVLEFVRGHPHSSASELVQGIYEAAREFADGEPQRDDITSVICRVGARS